MNNIPQRILLTLFFSFLVTISFAQPPRFFTSDSELSNSMVTSIEQDGLGFIWIATEDGLNRFDGLNFVTYKRTDGDSTSLLSNFVSTLFSDNSNRLLVGCVNGLMKYDPNLDRFFEIPIFRDSIRLQPHITSIIQLKNQDILISTSGHGIIRLEQNSEVGHSETLLVSRLSTEFLEVIFEDFYQRLWIGTENEGIILYDTKTDSIRNFNQMAALRGSLTSNYITSIAEDYKRNVYIGTANGGVLQFDERSKTFTELETEMGTGPLLPVNTIFSDTNNNLWVGTSGMGLWQIDASEVKLIRHSVSSPRVDIAKSKIHAITEDNEGNLWLGIFLKGVFMIPGRTNQFHTISYQQVGAGTLGTGCVMAIAEDANKSVWVGTDSDGIYQLNHQTGESTNYRLTTSGQTALPPAVSAMIFDDKNKLWLGTSLDGFFGFDPVTKRKSVFRNNPSNINSLSNDKVQCFEKDENGYLWIGTSGGGLNRFDPSDGSFKRYLQEFDNENSLCNNWVNTVFVDSKGLIWVGTYNRVSIFNPSTDTFTTLSTANNLLPNNIVYFINEDSSGFIWIGTNDGLVKYDRDTHTSRIFTTSEGLVNNVITAILEDDQGQMWISTHNGLSCYSPQTDTFKNYYVHDGLQGNEFRRNAALRNHMGDLFFGGINGLTWFVPNQILHDSSLPTVYFTDLILHNNVVQIGEKINDHLILSQSISRTDNVELLWQQKNVSIEFSSIGFVNPERISYQYRLLGLEDAWVTTNSENRRASYTNLKHGTYVLQVRAVDNDYVSDIQELTIVITHPWWVSWWFTTIGVILALLIVFAIYQYIKSRIKNRNIRLKMEQKEKINQAKLSFFTNISHEIRTPLTLIAGPLEKLIAENKDNPSLMKSLRMISKNSQRLMRLVTQLLDVRKIERDQMTVNYAQIDLVKFTADIMHAFDYLAEKKQIRFSMIAKPKRIPVWIDPDSFDKVLFNVLSNAFKFTPVKGDIDISISTGEFKDSDSYLKEYAEILIHDTGIGIEEEKLERIFDRFYQIKNGNNANFGTGIGLHLSRSLIELQHGQIFAMNRSDRQGSTFVIRIPLGVNHLANAQITHTPLAQNPVANIKRFKEYIDATIEADEEIVTNDKKRKRTSYKILIADDDEQMRNYLRDELKNYFDIIVSINGKDALEKVHSNQPDLVLSDVVMPVMDGTTLCRKLKSNPATSHLPVVLLSSRLQDEHILHAMDVGADAYFEKPFQTDKLIKNIHNLLANRERVKLKFSPGGNINAPEKTYPSADKALMEKIMQVIESRISDPTLTAEDLSRDIGMSRVHLFRRMKKITGQPPSDFIRKIRLQKAAQLLDGNTGFIKEIAFDVGFTSLSYFSRCFHDFYGIKPSEYVRREKGNESTSDKKE